MADTTYRSAAELTEGYAKGNLKVSQTVREHLQRIQKLNQKLNAYLEVKVSDPEAVEAGIASRRQAPLYGIPIAIKDNICVEGWEATCASRILKGYRSPYSATVIRRLTDAGAVLMGRTNMDEFAFGSSCENSAYGPTRNPWDIARAPGGSSGGSAAAVASGMAVMALGSDTGGSIRQPASFCGIVGLKPTYGRVSRYGLVAFASSLDQIGPMTRTVEDAAGLLEVIAGFDPMDSTSAQIPVPQYRNVIGKPVKGMKVGLPKEYFVNLPAPVKALLDKSKAILEAEGVKFVEVSLPHTEYAVAVYYIIAPSEASSNLARFDGVRYGARDPQADSVLSVYSKSRQSGFGPETKRRVILGTYALSSGYYDAYYLKAMKVRKKIVNDFEAAFKKCDVMMTPTAPESAFKIGEKSSDPLSMYLSDIYTISANLAGVPALSVPAGLDSSRMPVGVQFMARPFDEESLFKVGHVFESKAGARGLEPGLNGVLS